MLGEDQAVRLFEVDTDPDPGVLDPIGPAQPGIDVHHIIPDDGVVGLHVVGELVERPTGCQVEASAGPDSVANALPVQGAAQLRAAVVDRLQFSGTGRIETAMPWRPPETTVTAPG